MGDQDKGIIVDNKPQVSQTPALTDDYEVEMELEKGQKQKVKFGEIKAGYMKDADYRKKTGEVAEERERIKAETARLQPYKQIADWYEAEGNEEKAKKIRAIIEGKEEAIKEGADFDPDDPYFKKMLEIEKRAIAAEQRAERLEQRAERLEQTYSTRELQKNIKDVQAEREQVKAEHPEFTDEDMQNINDLAIAKLNRGEDSNLVGVSKYYVKLLQSHGEKSVNDYLSKKEKDAENAVEVGTLPPPPPDRKISLDDGTAKKALRDTLKQSTKLKNE